ncbi:MAG TPA: hypothetical protein PLR76_07475 [Hyphomonas sp.]|nr:hypothetical protein [Hyphomonas sp.]MCB9972501.1 hypothetical protein [Hyphomonas sp.]MCC0017652.1 hypothetical protein [Rhodobiaceae bacterium]HPE48219.1 hypothetical protein [Hyphomonas sp.]
MGAEFLDKRNKGYTKHIDRKRAALATSDLFTQEPNDQPRRVIAKIRRGASLAIGDKLIIEKNGAGLIGCQGNSVVAEIENASPTISDAVSKSSGVATGTVEKVNAISGTAEVSIK